MQQNTMKFGVVVVANSSCLHPDLYLCSSFSFDVISVSLCTCMVKDVMHANVLGNVSTAFLHNRVMESHEIWWDCST